MPAEVDRCVERVMAQGKSKSEAFAICSASMDKSKNFEKLDLTQFDPRPFIKDTESKNALHLHGVPMIPVPVIRPTLDNPKFDQEYCGYTDTSPFEFQQCQNCMHFIKGDGGMDNVCQITEANPKRIVDEGFCRFFRSFADLEGFIPSPIDMDDSLPSDMSEMFKDEEED